METEKKGNFTYQAILSKKKYALVSDMLADQYGNDAKLTETLTKFCDIMNFDPNASSYTKEKGQKVIKARREKAQELGVSIYAATGQAKYRKNKQIPSEPQY
jgi:hypothetical protein